MDGDKTCSPVGTVIVTLERPNNMVVLGTFVAGDGGDEWEYWEGKFGPSELAEHVSLWPTVFVVMGTTEMVDILVATDLFFRLNAGHTFITPHQKDSNIDTWPRKGIVATG